MALHRDKVCFLMQKKTNFDEVICKDIEIGIYNWTIDYSIQHDIVKSWKNPKFLKAYIEKARSVLSNLDKNSYIRNQNLIKRIEEHEFLPHELPYMKPEHVFPDRWRQTIESLMKKYENAYENKPQAMTNMFTCGKCKKKECTFYELQTRSGDEASTIFIRCINCGNSWRQ